MKKKWFLLIFSVIIILGGYVFLKPAPQYLKMVFLDVPSASDHPSFKGIGQCVLIQTPEGLNYIIDAGMRGSYEEVIKPYLRENNIDTISALIISHPHGDHYGGAVALVKFENVQKIYTNGHYMPAYLYREFISVVQERNIDYGVLREGDEIMFGDAAKGTVINAHNPRYGDNINNGSIVIALNYGKVNILLTGDAEMAAEDFMIENYGEFLKAHILQAAHHGSASSTSMKFLNAVRPKAAVIQAGSPNSFGFPAPSVLNNLSDFNVDVYRNDHHGNITVKTDGRTYSVKTQKVADVSDDGVRAPVKLTENYVEAKILSDEGWRLVREKDYYGALEKLMAAEKLYKEDASIYSRLGMAYKQTGSREKSKESFLKALEIDEEEAYAHLHLGMHYVHIEKDNEKARQHLEMFLKLRPEDYSASIARDVLSGIKK